METRTDQLINHDARLNWPVAIGAGLITGAIVWLLSHGTPWFASGVISPTLMGRSLKPTGAVDPSGSVLTVLAQAIASICYGLIVAAAVFRLRGIPALGIGLLVGGALYGLNFVVFHFVEDVEWSNGEWTVLATHLVFGILAAGLYKGLAARREGSAI